MTSGRRIATVTSVLSVGAVAALAFATPHPIGTTPAVPVVATNTTAPSPGPSATTTTSVIRGSQSDDDPTNSDDSAPDGTTDDTEDSSDADVTDGGTTSTTTCEDPSGCNDAGADTETTVGMAADAYGVLHATSDAPATNSDNGY